MVEFSNCHNAPVTVEGDRQEGTHYYVCAECDKPCDLWRAEPPTQSTTPSMDKIDSIDKFIETYVVDHHTCRIGFGDIRREILPCTFCEAQSQLLYLLAQAKIEELQRVWKTAVDNDVAGPVKWELEDRIAQLKQESKKK